MIRSVFGPDGAKTEGTGQEAVSRGGDVVEEDGVAAETGTETRSEAPPVLDEGAPVGPGEGEEAAFLAEQRTIEPAGMRRGANGAQADDEGDATAPLPPLEDLVNRIPAETRALMDELFRAKFVTVKRVPKSALK